MSAPPTVLGSITGALGSAVSAVTTGVKAVGNAAASGVTAVKDKVAGPSPVTGAVVSSTAGGRRSRKSRKSKKSKKKTHRRR